MNKLVVKDYDYVKGNTALKPNRKSTDHNVDKKYEDLRKSKIDRKNRLKDKRNKDTKGIIQVGSLILLLGIATVWRDANVYAMRNNLSDIKKQINQVTNENEALKVDLLKVSSLENIKSVAEGKLKMVIPNKDEVVRVDLSKENFEKYINNEEKNAESQGNLLTKIKDVLFN